MDVWKTTVIHEGGFFGFGGKNQVYIQIEAYNELLKEFMVLKNCPQYWFREEWENKRNADNATFTWSEGAAAKAHREALENKVKG